MKIELYSSLWSLLAPVIRRLLERQGTHPLSIHVVQQSFLNESNAHSPNGILLHHLETLGRRYWERGDTERCLLTCLAMLCLRIGNPALVGGLAAVDFDRVSSTPWSQRLVRSFEDDIADSLHHRGGSDVLASLIAKMAPTRPQHLFPFGILVILDELTRLDPPPPLIANPGPCRDLVVASALWLLEQPS